LQHHIIASGVDGLAKQFPLSCKFSSSLEFLQVLHDLHDEYRVDVDGSCNNHCIVTMVTVQQPISG
jgi:hypothetical protein